MGCCRIICHQQWSRSQTTAAPPATEPAPHPQSPRHLSTLRGPIPLENAEPLTTPATIAIRYSASSHLPKFCMQGCKWHSRIHVLCSSVTAAGALQSHAEPHHAASGQASTCDAQANVEATCQFISISLAMGHCMPRSSWSHCLPWTDVFCMLFC